MAQKVSFSFENASFMADDASVAAIKDRVTAARNTLVERTGAGNDFLGWIDLPIDYDKEEFDRIKKAAAKIQSDSDVLLVIGIGGSYLGARAAIEALRHSFYNMVDKSIRKTPEIYYCGNNLSSTYICDLVDVIGDRDFSINVISKSGTTTECSVAFRLFKEMLEKKYGKAEAAKRIYATTDKARGALKTLTAVGLLPIAASGADLDALMAGAAKAREYCLNNDFDSNDALKYVAYRNVLHEKGLGMEILGNFEPSLHYITEWWKQLYGESEGKDGKGIFPAGVDFTTDLHSLGQFIQEGTKNHFETFLNVKNPRRSVVMQEEAVDLDGLNYLTGKTVDFINKCAMNGTILAHVDGQVPNIRIDMEEISEETVGELFYMFEFACGVSGYVLGVNPFNQPGVESYKKNMFALLGKPGYEEMTAALRERLGE